MFFDIPLREAKAAHNRSALASMKSLRITTAKTRKGVIAWLAKHNPFLNTAQLYEADNVIAVHVHRVTGALIFSETKDGRLWRTEHHFMLKAA